MDSLTSSKSNIDIYLRYVKQPNISSQSSQDEMVYKRCEIAKKIYERGYTNPRFLRRASENKRAYASEYRYWIMQTDQGLIFIQFNNWGQEFELSKYNTNSNINIEDPIKKYDPIEAMRKREKKARLLEITEALKDLQNLSDDDKKIIYNNLNKKI